MTTREQSANQAEREWAKYCARIAEHNAEHGTNHEPMATPDPDNNPYNKWPSLAQAVRS